MVLVGRVHYMKKVNPMTDEYDEHFPAATKDEGQVQFVTNYSDETAQNNSRAAGDITAQDKPARTQEMVRAGQVWVALNNPDGTHRWEIRGTGAKIRSKFPR
jgi:hypothetical protein